MIKNFKNKFGKTDDNIVIIGDWNKGDYNMKGKEPIITKKFKEYLKILVIKHI